MKPLVPGAAFVALLLVSPILAGDSDAFEKQIATIMRTWEGGPYTGKWGQSQGVSRDIPYDGRSVLQQDRSQKGTYCVGATLEAFCVAYARARHDKTLHDVGKSRWMDGRSRDWFRTFLAIWYLRRDLKETFAKQVKAYDVSVDRAQQEGCAYAIEWAGLGHTVDIDDLQRGDFIQFWYGKSAGHSAIVWDTEKQDGKLTRVTYWSSQRINFNRNGNRIKPGYGFRTRSIGEGRGEIERHRLHAARVVVKGG